MVGEPQGRRRLVEEVAALYDWIETQLRREPDRAGRCQACGACCDFPAYDHWLFVTPPELVYLAAKLAADRLKPMPDGRCPYQIEGKCSIHEHRFLGCRTFCCTGDVEFQNGLAEAALQRLKALCAEFQVPYRYLVLPVALNTFDRAGAMISDTCRSAEAPGPADRGD